jgi:hypothetical protein
MELELCELPLALDLGDLPDQVARFVAIKLSNFGDSVDIFHKVSGCAKKAEKDGWPSHRPSVCPPGVMTISTSRGAVQSSSSSKQPRIARK